MLCCVGCIGRRGAQQSVAKSLIYEILRTAKHRHTAITSLTPSIPAPSCIVPCCVQSRPRNMEEAKTTYEIYGYHNCSYANSAVSKANQVQSKHPDTVTVKTQITSRTEFKQWLSQNMNRVGQHRTSPACFANDKFVGGCDDFSAHLDTKYPGEQSDSFCTVQ